MNWNQLLALLMQLGTNAAGGYLGQPAGLGDWQSIFNEIAAAYPERLQGMMQQLGQINPLISQYLQEGSPYLARVLAESGAQTSQAYQNQREQLAQRLASQGFGAGGATGGTIAAAQGELGQAEANTQAENFLKGLLANETQRFNAANVALQEANLLDPARQYLPNINPQIQGPLAGLFNTAPGATGLVGTAGSVLNSILGLGGSSGGLGAGIGLGPAGWVDTAGLTGGSNGVGVGLGANASAGGGGISGLLNSLTSGGLGTAALGGGIGGLIGAFDPGYGGIGKTASSGIDAGLTALLGALGGPIGLGAGALASVIGGMFNGANPNQVPMAQIRQTFDAAADNIRHAAMQGYISEDQMKQLLNTLSTQGVSAVQNALSQYPNANQNMKGTGTDIQGDISALLNKPLGNVTLKPYDPNAITNLLMNPNTPGWYGGSINSGNQLAQALLGSLNAGSPTSPAFTMNTPTNTTRQPTSLAEALNQLSQNSSGQLTSPTQENPFAGLLNG